VVFKKAGNTNTTETKKGAGSNKGFIGLEGKLHKKIEGGGLLGGNITLIHELSTK
jgi:hypothetical protein